MVITQEHHYGWRCVSEPLSNVEESTVNMLTKSEKSPEKKNSLRRLNVISVLLLCLVAMPILFYKFALPYVYRLPSIAEPQKLTAEFHKLFYDSALRQAPLWMGTPIQKNPLDLMIVHEILYEVKPDVIIEAGTADGGSALYMANMMDLLGHGKKVVTIDIKASAIRPSHPRIEYLVGSSTAPEIVAKVKSFISPGDKVLVSLDSDHRRNHVLRELQLYGPMVTKGSYLILEDTNINGHPVYPTFGPGPMEALQEFLKTNSDFEIDLARERLLVTFNPSGFLRKR
jgi:cephalosporin hydroxylase